MIDDHGYNGNHINGITGLTEKGIDVKQSLLWWTLQARWIEYNIDEQKIIQFKNQLDSPVKFSRIAKLAVIISDRKLFKKGLSLVLIKIIDVIVFFVCFCLRVCVCVCVRESVVVCVCVCVCVKLMRIVLIIRDWYYLRYYLTSRVLANVQIDRYIVNRTIF